MAAAFIMLNASLLWLIFAGNLWHGIWIETRFFPAYPTCYAALEKPSPETIGMRMTGMRTKRNKRNLQLLGISILSCAVFMVLGTLARPAAATDTTPWIVPAKAKSVKNPITPTPKNLAEAKEIYSQNCAPCHGDQGDGQGLMGSSLDPPAASFTDANVMRSQTDGELFWKMGEGRGSMPTFKDQLTDTQRWELVNYLRTFAKRAAPKKAPIPKSQN